VEKWFERAKQEAGLGAFEVRTYTSLPRHWLCVRVVMAFLAEQTALTAGFGRLAIAARLWARRSRKPGHGRGRSRPPAVAGVNMTVLPVCVREIQSQGG
jgi:hypothetical protein